MNDLARAFWLRAIRALATASSVTQSDPDCAASRAYYAAFYGVSALFALQDRLFKKHTAVQAAVHRELVSSGRWSKELGAQYSSLLESREIGDYGLMESMTSASAEKAVRAAQCILQAVQSMCPELADDIPSLESSP
ncbi:MAG: HEPN domain-containing protein [Candidatus Hydrogenedentes bacterium]|nr:HEPN domain-containing protein [Candidatus Hydrogenedentota bacterium]